MHVLFVHENLPAQFKHVAPWLAQRLGWRVTFAAANPKAALPAGVEKVSRMPGEASPPWQNAPGGGEGRRIFAYLKASPTVGRLLERLGLLGWPIVAYVDGLRPDVRRQLASPTLNISARPFDLATAATQCDAAILGGGHGATAEMLLAGKPVLELPSALEQRMTGAEVERLGAGVQAPAGEARVIIEKLRLVLEDNRHARAARRFAERYAAFDPRRQRLAMLGRAEQLLAGRDGATGSRGGAAV